jgi:hypothetical protein
MGVATELKINNIVSMIIAKDWQDFWLILYIYTHKNNCNLLKRGFQYI